MPARHCALVGLPGLGAGQAALAGRRSAREPLRQEAGNATVIVEGAIILAKALNDRGLMGRHTRLFLDHVRTVFGAQAPRRLNKFSLYYSRLVSLAGGEGPRHMVSCSDPRRNAQTPDPGDRKC